MSTTMIMITQMSQTHIWINEIKTKKSFFLTDVWFQYSIPSTFLTINRPLIKYVHTVPGIQLTLNRLQKHTIHSQYTLLISTMVENSIIIHNINL